MSEMNTTRNVAKQYSDDKNLTSRIDLHSKYSTNKQGFVSWLFDKYSFLENYRILELGCGNGEQWNGRIDFLPNGCDLILSDFSDGMVNAVRGKYSKHHNVSFDNIDIQSIDYPNESFNAVIANHMLYHIPDLPKALSEVKRVLKQGGKFYCTTNGNGGMRLFLRDALRHFDIDAEVFTKELTFSLQNGTGILNRYFSDVSKYDYIDSLSVTETQALIDWIKSTVSIASYTEKDIDKLYDYFERIRKRDGEIILPKECGLFIAVK